MIGGHPSPPIIKILSKKEDGALESGAPTPRVLRVGVVPSTSDMIQAEQERKSIIPVKFPDRTSCQHMLDMHNKSAKTDP